MNKTHRIQPKVLIENVSKLDMMAEKYGLTREQFMDKLANDKFIVHDEDYLDILEVAKIKAPYKREDIETLKRIEITNWDIRKYSFEITDENESNLVSKALKKRCVGKSRLSTIAKLLNVICINGITFLDDDSIELIKKVNGGKK